MVAVYERTATGCWSRARVRDVPQAPGGNSRSGRAPGQRPLPRRGELGSRLRGARHRQRPDARIVRTGGLVACDEGSPGSAPEHRVHARLFFGDRSTHLHVVGAAGSGRPLACVSTQARARDCLCGGCDRNCGNGILLSRAGLRSALVGGVACPTHFATVVASTLVAGRHSLDAALGLHGGLPPHERPVASSSTDLGCGLARDSCDIYFCRGLDAWPKPSASCSSDLDAGISLLSDAISLVVDTEDAQEKAREYRLNSQGE